MNARRRARMVGAGLTAGMVLLGTAAAATPAYSAPGDQPTKPTKPGQPDRGGKGDGAAGKPKREKDTAPPSEPALGDVTVKPKGRVELPVTAEKDAKVVVREDGGRIVARTQATGAPEVLSWTTNHGEHEYSVVATDKARNASDAATISVDVDARAPRVKRFAVTAGDEKDSRSSVQIRTEAGVDFRLLIDGKVVDSGTTKDGRIDQALELADGRHAVRLELTDEVGNKSGDARRLVVRIPELSVNAEVLSEPTDTVQVVRVTGMAGTTAVVSVPGQADLRVKLPRGEAEVELTLEDGSYDPTVTVTDSQGRTGTVTLAGLSVDTTPPELAVGVDQRRADEGKLVAEVTADQDSVVSWQLLDGDRVVADGKYVALGDPQKIERDVEEGSFDLEVTATDTFDRTTVDRTAVSVAADPLSASTLALIVLAALVAVGAAVGGTISFRRHRRRTLGLTRKVKPRKVKGRKAKARVAQVDREAEVAFADADELWRRRHDALTTLLDVANGAAPVVPVLPELEPLPDEQVLYQVGAELTEMMDSDRLEVTLGSSDGELVVTTHRVAFVSREQERRDWWLPLVEQLRHKDHRRTTIKLRDSDTRSWLEYDDPEITRLYVDLVVAGQNGTRGAYVAGLAQGLRDHEMRRPTPPGHEPARA